MIFFGQGNLKVKNRIDYHLRFVLSANKEFEKFSSEHKFCKTCFRVKPAM